MNGAEAVAEVQQILGWRSDKETETLLALQFAQREREKPGITFPWWLLRSDQPLTVTAANQEVDIPSDFIQEAELEDGDMYYRRTITSAYTFVKKMDFRTAEERYFGRPSTTSLTVDQNYALVTGAPKNFVLRRNILIYPIPNVGYTLLWNYWGQDAQIDLSLANAWLTNAPWVLIGDAAKKLGSDLGNANAVATASGILARAEANMFRSVIHRDEAGRSRSMGSRL